MLIKKREKVELKKQKGGVKKEEAVNSAAV